MVVSPHFLHFVIPVNHEEFTRIPKCWFNQSRIKLAEKNKIQKVYNLDDSGFFLDFLYQGGVKSTVSGVFEVLK